MADRLALAVLRGADAGIALAVVWDLDKPGIYFLDEVEQGPRRLHPLRYSRCAVGDIVRGRNQGAVKIST
jgi:hypothetical protein